MDTKQQLLGNVLATVAELEGESGGYMGAIDWLEDQLNIEEWRFDGQGNYKGVEVLVACGGPDIRVDTCREVVVGRWGHDTIERSYIDVIGLDDLLEEVCPVGGGA